MDRPHPSITSLPEATKELADIQQRVAHLLNYLKRMQGLPENETSFTLNPTQFYGGASVVPETLVSRVLKAMHARGGGPMAPREIVQAIKEKHFALGEPKNLYNRIFNTIKYLMRSDPPKVAHSKEGYSLTLAGKESLREQ